MAEEKVIRAGDDEHVVLEHITKAKLDTIMKRFLGSKVSDPEISKWYMVKDGLHFMATSLGCAVDLHFHNKYAGKFVPITKETHYVKPAKGKDKEEVSDVIWEYVDIKDGKKKERLRTGDTLEFPDVAGLFDKYEAATFDKFFLDLGNLDDLITVHEVIEKLAKMSGKDFCAELNVGHGQLNIMTHDSPVQITYNVKIDSEAYLDSFYYNPTYMVAILKSIKDLKVDKVMMMVKEDSPILFYSANIDYIFKFAFNRVLTR